MQKYLQVIGSFLLSLFQGGHGESLTYEQILNDLSVRIRTLLLRSMLGLLGLLLLFSGFLITSFHLLNQYDQTGFMMIEAVTAGGLVLFFGGLICVYQAQRLPTAGKDQNLFHQGTSTMGVSGAGLSSTLEQALASLVLDYVEERKLTRELKKNQFAPASYSSHDKEEQLPIQ